MKNCDDGLTILGNGGAAAPGSPDEAVIETFENRNRGRDYTVSFECPEFTCVCPRTGQPDFGTLKITYVPGERCIESKSLKFYLFSFRNQGMFNEEAVNRILADLVKAAGPGRMEVEGRFSPRGGISITVRAEYP